jgi:hypothetical protein
MSKYPPARRASDFELFRRQNENGNIPKLSNGAIILG